MPIFFCSSCNIDNGNLPFNISLIIEQGLSNSFNFKYSCISSSFIQENSTVIIDLFNILFTPFIILFEKNHFI